MLCGAGSSLQPGLPFTLGKRLDSQQHFLWEAFLRQLFQRDDCVFNDIMKHGSHSLMLPRDSHHHPQRMEDVWLARFVELARVRNSSDLNGAFKRGHTRAVSCAV